MDRAYRENSSFNVYIWRALLEKKKDNKQGLLPSQIIETCRNSKRR